MKWISLIFVLYLGTLPINNLIGQCNLLESLRDKSKYVFEGLVEDNPILWDGPPMEVAIVIKINKFIKGNIDTTNVPRAMFLAFTDHYYGKGWMPIRVKKGERYIFFVKSIENNPRIIYIRPYPIDSGPHFKEVSVFQCNTTDYWIHGIKYSQEIENQIIRNDEWNKIDTLRSEPNIILFNSIDSMATISKEYIDLGEVIEIIETNDKVYPHAIIVKIIGDLNNEDENVIRSDEVKIYLKNLDCICSDKITKEKKYSFFLKKEEEKYVLIDECFGVIANIFWKSYR